MKAKKIIADVLAISMTVTAISSALPTYAESRPTFGSSSNAGVQETAGQSHIDKDSEKTDIVSNDKTVEKNSNASVQVNNNFELADPQPAPIPVKSETYGAYEYDVLSNGTIEITSFSGTSANVYIPSSIDNKDVSSIGYGCFEDNAYLQTVTIPDSVVQIENNAFSGCTSLNSVTLSKNLTTLGYSAFDGCTALSSIEIPKSLTNVYTSGRNGAFSNSGLKSVTFEDGITNIPDCLFYYCASIEKIIIPDTVLTIGSSAFESCTGLTKIDIPDNVLEIGSNAFSGCTSLNSVTLSKNLKTLYSAFNGCTALSSIEIPKSLTNVYTSGRDGAFSDSGLKSVTFEDGITNIPDCLFYYCASIEKIIIPDTVLTIGSSAFESCTGLTKIDIPDNVLEIGSSAFSGCSSLNSVKLSKNLTTLENSAFNGCTALTSIEIPKSLINVGDDWYGGVFANTGLKSVTFETGTTQIPNNLLYNCTTLDKITIPDTVLKIGDSAFENCTGLTNIIIPGNVTEIGSNAFSDCVGLTKIDMSGGVTKIGNYAFNNCSALDFVVLPKTVKEIGFGVFNGCKTIKKIEIPEGINTLPSQLFEGCTSLTDVTIPETVTVIEDEVFKNCDALTEISIPDSVTDIQWYAFYDCDGLVSVILPKSLKAVTYECFYDCDKLAEVTIQDSVTEIQIEAFYSCDVLKSVKIGNNVTKIEENAFRACHALTDIVLPKSVTEIDENAFAECVNLTDVTVYPSVSSIPTSVFSYPTKMTMHGYAGTYAEQYAKDRNMKFAALPKISADKITVDIPDCRYIGEQIKPEFKLIDSDGYVLKDGSDFTVVSYGDNLKVGKGSVSIMLTGIMYEGTIDTSFNIIPAYIGDGNCDSDGRVYFNGWYLNEGTDYTVERRYDLDTMGYEFTFTGLGSFTGTYILSENANPLFTYNNDQYEDINNLNINWDLDFSLADDSVWASVDKVEAVWYQDGRTACGLGVQTVNSGWVQIYNDQEIYGLQSIVIDDAGGLDVGKDARVNFGLWWSNRQTESALQSIIMYDKDDNVVMRFPKSEHYLDYEFNDNDNVVITGGNPVGVFEIPQYINFDYVDEVAANAFEGNEDITALNINMSVYFGDNAFKNCKNLKEVHFDRATNYCYFSDTAFDGCSEDLTFYAYYNNSSAKDYAEYNGIKFVPEFDYVDEQTGVIIGDPFYDIYDDNAKLIVEKTENEDKSIDYDVSFENSHGTVLVPSDEVEVMIPIPEGWEVSDDTQNDDNVIIPESSGRIRYDGDWRVNIIMPWLNEEQATIIDHSSLNGSLAVGVTFTVSNYDNLGEPFTVDINMSENNYSDTEQSYYGDGVYSGIMTEPVTVDADGEYTAWAYFDRPLDSTSEIFYMAIFTDIYKKYGVLAPDDIYGVNHAVPLISVENVIASQRGKQLKLYSYNSEGNTEQLVYTIVTYNDVDYIKFSSRMLGKFKLVNNDLTNPAPDNPDPEKPEVLIGDVNSDGKVTMRDQMELARWLVGWDVQIDEDAADVNGDGKVTMRDQMTLARRIVGWDV